MRNIVTVDHSPWFFRAATCTQPIEKHSKIHAQVIVKPNFTYVFFVCGCIESHSKEEKTEITI